MQSSEQFDQRQLETVRRLESPFAALTLTRSATLAIVTTGTTITWQTQTRGIGITWATTDITIPTAGFYAIQTMFATTTNITMLTQLVVNTVNLGYFANSWTTINFHVGTLVRYFSTGDVIQIRVVPSVNATISVNAETVVNASPILHITQLTAAIP